MLRSSRLLGRFVEEILQRRAFFALCSDLEEHLLQCELCHGHLHDADLVGDQHGHDLAADILALQLDLAGEAVVAALIDIRDLTHAADVLEQADRQLLVALERKVEARIRHQAALEVLDGIDRQDLALVDDDDTLADGADLR